MDTYDDTYQRIRSSMGIPATVKKSGDNNAKLKSVAGLIQGLTYREMNDFSAAITKRLNDTSKELPEILLEVSEEFLNS